MSNCYNLGSVKYSGTSEGTPMFGGICGGICYDVDKCCNIGSISYGGGSTKYVGAMIGQMLGNLSNSYMLNNTELNGIARNYTSTPEPTKVDTVSEMPTVLEIVGDAFKKDTNNINNGYPILNWQ